MSRKTFNDASPFEAAALSSKGGFPFHATRENEEGEGLVKDCKTTEQSHGEIAAMLAGIGGSSELIADGNAGPISPWSNPAVPNPDNSFLGPLVVATGDGKACAIGAVEEVNGRGAAECPDFIPTKHELEELVRYWARRKYEFQIDYFLCAVTGSTAIRVQPYAQRRINRIADVIGADAVEKIVAAVEDEFRRQLGEEKWRIFKDGTPEEVAEVQEEIFAEIEAGPTPERIANRLAKTAVSSYPRVPVEV